ncbi:MAG: Lrp/AsnC family transcriptional regulator [Succinivibrio sp.]
MKLDEQDLLLLKALSSDCRLSLRDLGDKCGLSAPAVSARIKRLEDHKIIKGYQVVLSDEVFALSFEAVISVKVLNRFKDAFKNYAKASLNVSSLLEITGEYNYLMVAAFDNLAQLSAFKNHIEQEYGEVKAEIVVNKDFLNRTPMSITN